MQNQYDQDLNQIRSACRSKDLDAVENTLARIDKEWAQTYPISYVNLLRAACDEIQSQAFDDKQRARTLLEARASLALETADDTQMDVQIHLLVSYLRLYDRIVTLKVSQFPQERKASADLWFHVWRKLEGLIDENWDPNDPKNEVKPYFPSANVPFRSGMAPEDIKDPKVRAEYEDHLKKNQRIAERNEQQRKLRELKAEYSQSFEDYIITIYSMSPSNTPELEGYLMDLKDDDMRRRILYEVSEKEKASN